jgi:predicted aldo/keto reductase-like oxidoreductase
MQKMRRNNMNYRENSRNGDKLSILGFGCMRFPTVGNVIDEKRGEELILKAIEGGVNYFDTAYIYHFGKSEGFLGKVLAKGYRDKVKIATKLPHYFVKGPSDLDKIFNTQLQRLQTGRIDYYLIHMLPDLGIWERLKSFGVEKWIEEKKKNGQIINIGFSFHGIKDQFVKLVDAYDWDFCQIQYNYLDENNQAGTSGLKYAASKGLPVIIMEPLRGGKIVNNLPREVNEIWNNAEPKRSPADWALRWIWNHPEVSVILSGMSTMEQVEENIRVASDARANAMTDKELSLFDRVKEIISSRTKVNCTGCSYCMPCPAGVDIPACFSLYNEKYSLKTKRSKINYIQNTGAVTSNPAYASLCKKCGKCEIHCPQGIPIREKLEDVSREMEGIFFKPVIRIAKRFMKIK